MQKETSQNTIDLFPSMWEVGRYRMLWLKHLSSEFNKENIKKWEKEVKETVLKIYYYEQYNRLIQGKKVPYRNILDTYKYFLKIGDIKAYKNMAYLLMPLRETKEAYKKAIINENYKDAQFYNNIIRIDTKPAFYLIELDEIFIAEKQNIAKNLKYLEQEYKKQKLLKVEPDLDVTFYEMAVEDAKYIALGLANSAEFIVDTMEMIQKDEDLLYLLIWVTDRFYDNYTSELIQELNIFNSKYILNTIKKYAKDKNKQKEIEYLYFSKVTKWFDESRQIDKKVLIATLKFYKHEKAKQDNILKLLKNQDLLNSIKQANNMEEYELLHILQQYLKTQKELRTE